MSEARRQTRIIFDACQELAANGRHNIRAGDVIDLLRERNQPLGIWKVTGEFATLEILNLIKMIPETAEWQLVENRSFEQAVEEYNGNWENLPTGT